MNRCRQMNNIILTVPEEAGGLRLDKWLTSQIEDLTRTAVQNLVESGEVPFFIFRKSSQ